MRTLLELRRRRAALIQEARHLLDTVEEEERELTGEEERHYEELMSDIDSLATQIERRERQQALEAELDEPAGEGPGQGEGRSRQRGTRPEPDDDPNIGMSDEEVERYSLVRAVRAAANLIPWSEARLEQEASRATAERLGIQPEGFFVPHDWVERQGRRQFGELRETRDLMAGIPSAGGYTVEEVLGSSFIELLRNRMVVRQAGATVLTGLQGDLAIPKQTGGATAYWVGEGGAPTESQQQVGQVALTPKTVGAYTDFSRRLILQSTLDVEAFVRSDLASVLQLAVDLAALHGTGAANEPLGVANVTGIGAPGTGAASLALVVDLETEVAVDNADVGRLAYITNATVRGTLKQTDIGTDTGMMIWNTMAGNTPVNGYPAWVTNQVTGTNIFFGNWADLILGFWSGMDVLVDPYTHSTSGTIRVVALQDVDVAVRHPESFALDSTT